MGLTAARFVDTPRLKKRLTADAGQLRYCNFATQQSLVRQHTDYQDAAVATTRRGGRVAPDFFEDGWGALPPML